MTRNLNHLLLIAIIFALILGSCDALPEDFDIDPTYVLVPVAEETAIPFTEEPSASAIDDTPVPFTEEIPAPTLEDTPPIADTSWPTVIPSSADFDYYVLSLSWSPNYCASNSDDTQQCSLGRKYAFVIHGLWPQYNKGYPSNCSSKPLPASVKAQFPGLYPSEKLFSHEWSKHGTCSGLSPSAYLTLTDQFRDYLQIPAAYRAPTSSFRTSAVDLKQAFLQANPALVDQSLAVNCSGSGRYLSELYVCFSKDGQPAACGADVLKSALKSCASAEFIVRNVR